MKALPRYQIEIANRIGRINGRACAVGTDFVVTRRPDGYTSILARLATREAAEQWIADAREEDVAQAANNFDDGGVQ